MGNPNHHLCIHAHFYQPPRENPWLGVIEAQSGAAPDHDWNEKISRECYEAMTHAPVRDETGIRDLFDNFWHLSFNIGPTLFAWFARQRPELARRLAAADRGGAAQFAGHGGALAQPYNHPILPLCSARDRHTQIVWGLREFAHRFGRPAEGLWLPETALDRHTVRALVAHGVRYVILSPRQAAYVRRFGEDEWHDVNGGAVDTRHPYRLFEVDGGGRTHFDRHLDVIFYNPGLSLKVSFEHLLRDPQRLEREILNCLDAEAGLPQLVTLATDGEIYGHHEPPGAAALAGLFSALAPRLGLYICTPGQYLAENPPCWEMRLWEGPDGRGSSWSCDHGVGRWRTDCGCNAGGGPDWNQAWRSPLRAALDNLSAQVNSVFAAELGPLLHDPWEARDDYVRVILEPDAATRADFLRRHARAPLDRAAELKLWRLCEASTNAMLMYTSCGWFFSDLAGVEPVQNLRYALRAAELAQDYAREDLTARLEADLARARSNRPEEGTGADIFRRQVLPTRHSPRQAAAAIALCRLLDLPEPAYAYQCEFLTEERARQSAWGRVKITDTRTTATEEWLFHCRGESLETAGALFAPPAETDFVKRARRLGLAEFARQAAAQQTALPNLPRDVRAGVFGRLTAPQGENLNRDLAALCERHLELLTATVRLDLPPPPELVQLAGGELTRRFTAAVADVVRSGEVGQLANSRANQARELAAAHRVWLDRQPAADRLGPALLARLRAFTSELSPEQARPALELLRFAGRQELPLRERPALEDAFWRALQPDAGSIRNPETRGILLALGQELGFSPDAILQRLGDH